MNSVGDVAPTFDAYTIDSEKTIIVVPYKKAYVVEVTAYFDLYQTDSTLVWSDTTERRSVYINDECIGLSYARLPSEPYIRNNASSTDIEFENALNLIIEYSVMSPPERWDILLHTYKI